jgi:hypothetical protein
VTERLPDGRIRIPARAETGGTIGDGMTEIGPGDPRYADYDAYLATLEAAVGGDPSWTVAGEIPDTGEQVTLQWNGGVTRWPADALDWAIAAADEGLVQLDDGPRLHAWLLSQEFRDVSQEANGHR